MTQQAVSKVLLKHIHDLPARQAKELRLTHIARFAEMREIELQALEKAQSARAQLAVIGRLIKIEEREAKLLGLDAPAR
ncbi:MAG: hypothetical protein ACHQZS_08075 [Candidatus Binatales bacterium]